ncbi:small lysine-rich protein 1 [Carcharodon carcharias]|uniref:small lysine-rich protein 1 n=1 Tax=Carcharodon carcharias TaxID=13397 RepID=UPI001B7F0E41|nr:small lysine-rich protein 1 [Carcharodon carcharias]
MWNKPSKSRKSKGKAQSASSKKGKGGKKGAGGRKKKKKDKKEKETEVDILSPAAMFNLYYISHNVTDSLSFRGFAWPGSPKKKGRR